MRGRLTFSQLNFSICTYNMEMYIFSTLKYVISAKDILNLMLWWLIKTTLKQQNKTVMGDSHLVFFRIWWQNYSIACPIGSLYIEKLYNKQYVRWHPSKTLKVGDRRSLDNAEKWLIRDLRFTVFQNTIYHSYYIVLI